MEFEINRDFSALIPLTYIIIPYCAPECYEQIEFFDKLPQWFWEKYLRVENFECDYNNLSCKYKLAMKLFSRSITLKASETFKQYISSLFLPQFEFRIFDSWLPYPAIYIKIENCVCEKEYHQVYCEPDANVAGNFAACGYIYEDGRWGKK